MARTDKDLARGIWQKKPAAADTLIRLWNKGDSASKIAAALGPDFTRSSVMGKASRLRKAGVELSHNNNSSWGGDRRAATPKPAPKPVAITSKPEKPAAAVIDPVLGTDGLAHSLLTIPRSACRFPVGAADGASQRFCGHAVKPQSPFCESHHAVCYVKSHPARPMKAGTHAVRVFGR